MTPKQLKDWRHFNKLSLTKAAKALGVARSSYAQWESGHTRLHPLLRLATIGYLHVTELSRQAIENKP